LAVVVELVAQLNGQASFRLADGPLAARLRETVLGELDADTLELLAESAYDIQVTLDACDGAVRVLDCRMECAGAEHLAEVALADLSGRELHELSLRLQALIKARSAAGKGADGRVTSRRKADGDRYDILQASRKLKVTAEWLKSTIPCTGYRYADINGRKTMRDCYWSRELIDRLCTIKESRPRREDEAYVASACCDGDLGWSKEIVCSLRKPEPKTPRIEEKFVPRVKARVISREFVNVPAPKRKKKGEVTDGQPE
jgi:hypothetical protein